MMFAITTAHEAAFEQNRRDRFIEELAVGSRDFLPEGAPFLTPSDRLTGARFVYDCAEAAGYETRGAHFFWLNMAALFGSHFFNDPQFGIIAPRQGKPDEAHELAYLNEVYQRVADYAQTVLGGPQSTLFNAALARFLDLLEAPGDLDRADLLETLRAIYPQKLKADGRVYSQKQASGAFRDKAVRLLGSDQPQALVTIAGLEMFFGHRFESDFFKPWLGAGLAECQPEEPGQFLDLRPLTGHVRGWLEIEQEVNYGP